MISTRSVFGDSIDGVRSLRLACLSRHPNTGLRPACAKEEPRDGCGAKRHDRQPDDDSCPFEPPDGEIEYPADESNRDTTRGDAQAEPGRPRRLLGIRSGLAGTREHGRHDGVARHEQHEGKAAHDGERAPRTERRERDAGRQ